MGFFNIFFENLLNVDFKKILKKSTLKCPKRSEKNLRKSMSLKSKVFKSSGKKSLKIKLEGLRVIFKIFLEKIQGSCRILFLIKWYIYSISQGFQEQKFVEFPLNILSCLKNIVAQPQPCCIHSFIWTANIIRFKLLFLTVGMQQKQNMVQM